MLRQLSGYHHRRISVALLHSRYSFFCLQIGANQFFQELCAMKFLVGASVSVCFAIFFLSPPVVFAQQGLPPTIVRTPEAKKAIPPRRSAAPRRAARKDSTRQGSTSVTDNTMALTDKQFTELQRRNPNAVFNGRCYVGQDPDPFIRSRLWRADDSGTCDTGYGSQRAAGPSRRDWAAAGTANTHAMSEAQFAAFRARHPTAIFEGRCYLGQDPDAVVRSSLRRRHDDRAC